MTLRSCSEAGISCGFSVAETKGPLTTAPVESRKQAGLLCTEGPLTMRKEHTEHGPSRLSCHQCDRSVNSSKNTQSRRSSTGRQRQTGSIQGWAGSI